VTPRAASAGASATAATSARVSARVMVGPPASAHAELATFLDLSAQIFCITDRSGALVWWNAAFERTLGYSAKELRGLRLDDLVHPDDREVPGSPSSASAPARASGAGSSGPPASTSPASASTERPGTSPRGGVTRSP